MIDVGLNQVEIKQAFHGVAFETEQGERLVVSMRDSGFEVDYSGDFGTHGFTAGRVDFQGGEITARGKAMKES